MLPCVPGLRTRILKNYLLLFKDQNGGWKYIIIFSKDSQQELYSGVKTWLISQNVSGVN